MIAGVSTRAMSAVMLRRSLRAKMFREWPRIIVIGGQCRNVGKTALAVDMILAGLPPATRAAAAVLSRHLERWVEAEPAEVLDAWRQRDALLGREVAWEGGSGVADGVDDRGYLLVLTASGERVAVGAGEVHLTRF